MPIAGAPMLDMALTAWSSVLMRMRCFSGPSIGIAALIAGKWNAWKQLRSAAKTHMRAKSPCPNHARTASASDIDPAPRSETIMTARRLYRSAARPPKGASSPRGNWERAMTRASLRAEPSVVVTCQMIAHPDAPLVMTENAWPLQIVATTHHQFGASGRPEALTGAGAEDVSCVI